MKRLFSGLRKKATKAGGDDERFGNGLWRHNRDRFLRAVDRYYATAVALHEARPSGATSAGDDANSSGDEVGTTASATDETGTARKDPVDVIVNGTHRLNALVEVVDAITADLHARYPVSGQIVPGPVRSAVGDVPELLTKASSKVGEAVLAASMARSEAAGRPIDSAAHASARFISDAEELLGRARANLARLGSS